MANKWKDMSRKRRKATNKDVYMGLVSVAVVLVLAFFFL